jgi:hypothetical protein
MAMPIRAQAALLAISSAVLAVACSALLRSGDWGVVPRIVLTVAPVLPMAWYCILMLRIIRTLDELELRIQLEGAVYALLGTAILIMATGLMIKGRLMPEFSLERGWPWLWISIFLLWSGGSQLAARRYR